MKEKFFYLHNWGMLFITIWAITTKLLESERFLFFNAISSLVVGFLILRIYWSCIFSNVKPIKYSMLLAGFVMVTQALSVYFLFYPSKYFITYTPAIYAIAAALASLTYLVIMSDKKFVQSLNVGKPND